MRYLVIPIILALSGCAALDQPVPVKRNFPEAAADLMNACPDLTKVDEGTTELSKVVSVVVDNYKEYHKCRIRVDGWIEWYKSQKAIFEEIK
jgi:hypothetical protein